VLLVELSTGRAWRDWDTGCSRCKVCAENRPGLQGGVANVVESYGGVVFGLFNQPQPALLPSYSPELNPVERLWLYLRERHLSHRLFDECDAIVDACCVAWNKLTPKRIVSLCNYPYIKQVYL
jgi:transposase